jgi:hypothetical protein
LKLK